MVFVPSDTPEPNGSSVFKNKVAIRVQLHIASFSGRSFVKEFKGGKRLDIFWEKLRRKLKPIFALLALRLPICGHRFNLKAGEMNPPRFDVPCVALTEILTVKDRTDLQLGMGVVGSGSNDGSRWNKQIGSSPTVSGVNGEG